MNIVYSADSSRHLIVDFDSVGRGNYSCVTWSVLDSLIQSISINFMKNVFWNVRNNIIYAEPCAHSSRGKNALFPVCKFPQRPIKVFESSSFRELFGHSAGHCLRLPISLFGMDTSKSLKSRILKSFATEWVIFGNQNEHGNIFQLDFMSCLVLTKKFCFHFLFKSKQNVWLLFWCYRSQISTS